MSNKFFVEPRAVSFQSVLQFKNAGFPAQSADLLSGQDTYGWPPDLPPWSPAMRWAFAIITGVPAVIGINPPTGLNAYDFKNGSMLLAWVPTYPNLVTVYHVYVNGVLNQTVTSPLATVVGLKANTTYDFKVVSVGGGVEQSATLDLLITTQPTSVMITTPMKRLWPFPNSTLD